MKKSFLLLLVFLLSICLFACTPGEKKVEMTFDQDGLVVDIEHTAQWDVKDKQGTKLATASMEGGRSFLENDGKHYLLNEESYVLIVNVLPQYSGEQLVVHYNGSPLTLTDYKRAEHQYRYEFTSAIADKHIFKLTGLATDKARILNIALPMPGYASSEASEELYAFGVAYQLENDSSATTVVDTNIVQVEYGKKISVMIRFGANFEHSEGVEVKHTYEETYGEVTKALSSLFIDGLTEETIDTGAMVTKKLTFAATYDILKMEVFVY